MFTTAVLPVSYREPLGRIVDMLQFLGYFDTRRVILLHITGGVAGDAADRRLGALADHLRGAIAERADADQDDSAAAAAARNIELRPEVRAGSPALEITRVADEHQADFVYFPWKRKSWIQRTLVGSTTQDVIRLSALPVFVYKPRTRWSAGDPFHIVYPTEFAATDAVIVPYLQYPGLAADTLTILNVRERAPDPIAEGDRAAETDRNLARLTREVASNFSHVEPAAAVGSTRRRITQTVRRSRAALLILGRRGGSGHRAGSLAIDAPCSVLIVGGGDR